MTLKKADSAAGASKDAKSKKKEEEAKSKEEEKKDEKKKDGEEPMAVDEEELSEEDKQLKEELELCVTRLGEDDQSLYPSALSNLGRLIRASTTSMTSVPKPLKFMIPHFDAVKVRSAFFFN